MPPTDNVPHFAHAISQSVNAPEISLTVVKLAASMSVPANAALHNNELPANANIVIDVRKTRRPEDIS